MSRKKNNKPKQQPQVPKPDVEYDVTRSMQRVKAYRPSHDAHTYRPSTKSNTPDYPSSFLNNNFDNHFSSTSEPSRDLYIHLSERVSDINDKNELAHTDLRKEIDAKISEVSNGVSDLKKAVDEKVSTSTFRYLIGGIIAAIILIVSIWFTLSYLPLVNKTDTHSDQLHELDKRVNSVETHKYEISTSQSPNSDVIIKK
jgi:hypothetical protein